MEENENIDKLSESDIYEVLKFANYIYNTNPFGYFTPDMSNRNLLDINNNPLVPTKDSVSKALKDYKGSQEQLQAYSEFMDTYDMLYSRLVEHYTNLLAFDLDYSCKNAYSPKTDYVSKEYSQDKVRVSKFLDNFEYRSEFQRILKEVMRHEICYTWFRDSQGTFNEDEIDVETTKKLSKYTLQIMPQNCCKLTGRWENGFLYDFDMSYFLRAGVSLNSYDPQFKKYWRDVFGDSNTPSYNPTKQLANRDGTFALWTQTSPNDGAWVFKLDDSNSSTTPFLSPMIMNCLTNEEVQKLQISKDMISAKAILAGEIQINEKQKSGTVTDTMAYNLSSLTKLLKLVKQGLDSNINAVAMPTANPKLYQYSDSNKDMLTNQLKNSVGQGNSASRLLYCDDKMSETEIQSAIVTDYNIVKKVYAQFDKFLNFYVNKKTRKYKFSFNLSGCTHPFVREYDKKNLLDLSDRGINLAPRAYAKVVGMKPQDFERYLEEGKYSGWIDGEENLLTQMLSIHTQSGKDSQGAPKKDSTEISDSGSIARDY